MSYNPKTSPSGNWWLVLSVIGLALLPLLLVRGEYGGSDGEAEAAIQELQPDYQPWATPLMEPASAEIESLLFALQAGLGAGVIGYAIGRYQGRQGRSTHRDP